MLPVSDALRQLVLRQAAPVALGNLTQCASRGSTGVGFPRIDLLSKGGNSGPREVSSEQLDNNK